MGTAGSLHPYFQPNFEECALYAHRMNKGYSKVVAFIPTGWAESSNYNKKNARSAKAVNLKELIKGSKINGNHDVMQVEVRLCAYSEHSTYNELRDCVEFMKPKRIIPTVFSGEKDYIAIQKRFCDLLDSQRAKQAFISKLAGAFTIGVKRKVEISSVMEPNQERKNLACKDIPLPPRKKSPIEGSFKRTDCKQPRQPHQEKVTKKKQVPRQLRAPRPMIVDDWKVAQLVNMGFTSTVAADSLISKNNNIEMAIEWLLLRK
jgi:hypothetical protein